MHTSIHHQELEKVPFTYIRQEDFPARQVAFIHTSSRVLASNLFNKSQENALFSSMLVRRKSYHLSIFRLWVRSFGMIRKRISDQRSFGSWCIKGAGESTLSKDSPVRLMHYDSSDPGSLILFQIIAKECTLHFMFNYVNSLNLEIVSPPCLFTNKFL